jgi:glycolate oxidase iron-sulfur subunit
MSVLDEFLDEDKALACVHCGLCLGACPTYLETGNENDSPRGRIYLMRSLQSGRIPVADAVHHIDLCLGCRACEVACPSGVQYGTLLEATRDHIETHHQRSPWQSFLRRVVIEKVFPYPERMELALAPARMVKAIGVERYLPKFARASLSLIPDRCEKSELPEFSPATGERIGAVGFVSGCVMSVMFGETHRNTVTLLNSAGYDVHVPVRQGCCGALFAHGGNLAEARRMARQNIAAFAELELDAIVINAAGCGSTLKEYGHLLEEDEEWGARGTDFSRKMRDLSEFLVAVGFESQLKGQGGDGPKVTFHDACHLAHPQGITRQPRELVKAIAGENFVELPESDVCCGSAGSYNLTEPEMAARLQARKATNILSTGAEIVVSTNPGCLLQIAAGLKVAGHKLRVLHLADYLAEFGGLAD